MTARYTHGAVTILGTLAEIPSPLNQRPGGFYYARDDGPTGALYILDLIGGVRTWNLVGGSAASSAYTPTNPSDWPIVPTTVQQALDFLSASLVNVYANAATGNDANPGTSALPVQTLARAVALLPLYGFGLGVVHLAPTGPYTMPADLALPGYPVILQGSWVDTGLGTLTTDGTSTSLSVASTTPLVVDASRGRRLRFTLGPNIGTTRMVRSNSAGKFNVFRTISPVPAAGEEYVIERPAVTINLAGTRRITGTSRLSMDGIALVTTGAGTLNFIVPDVRLNGVELDFGAFFQRLVFNGRATLGSLQDGSTFQAGDGTYMHGAAFFSGPFFDNAQAWSFDFVCDSTGVTAEQGALRQVGFDARNSRISAQQCASLTLYPDSGFVGASTMNGLLGANLQAVDCQRGSVLYLLQVDISGVSGVGSAGVLVKERGQATFVSVSGANGAGAYGVIVDSNSAISVSGSLPLNSITGALGDVLLGTTPLTWAAAAVGVTDAAKLCLSQGV